MEEQFQKMDQFLKPELLDQVQQNFDSFISKLKVEVLKNLEEEDPEFAIQEKLERIHVSLISKLSNSIRDRFDEEFEVLRNSGNCTENTRSDALEIQK